MDQELLPGCARCPFEPSGRICQDEEGMAPTFCPTVNKAEVIEKALEELKKRRLKLKDEIAAMLRSAIGRNQ